VCTETYMWPFVIWDLPSVLWGLEFQTLPASRNDQECMGESAVLQWLTEVTSTKQFYCMIFTLCVLCSLQYLDFHVL
jgi:hypothetical protein